MVVCALMEEGQMTIKPCHLVARFATAARHHDRYDGSILGAVGEQQGEDKPTWVKLKQNVLQWGKKPTGTRVGGGQRHGSVVQRPEPPNPPI